MVAEKWVEAERPWTVDELKESRRMWLRFVGFVLTYGVVFTLLSFLMPGISMEQQIMCWENAAMAFAMAAYITWTHLTVHKTELSLV